MKDCKGIKDLLSPFLEGEVAGREKAAVEAHLESCSDCRSDLALLRQTVTALRGVPDLPPPAAILHAVRKEVSPEPAKGFFRRFFREGAWVGVPIGALAMAVLGIAAFVLQDRYPEVQEGPDVTAPRQTVTPAVEKKTDKAGKEQVHAPSAAPSPAPAPFEMQVTVDTPAAEEKPGDSLLFADGKSETAAAPAAEGDDTSRRRAPEPPAERPAIPAEASPAVADGVYDNAAAKGSVASRPVVPSQPVPVPSAPSAPPAVSPPGDTYRSGEQSAEGMKDVRRLLESSELLSPGGRENGRSTMSGVDDAVPAGPARRYGSEAGVADLDGADEKRPAGLGQAAAPEMKKLLKRKARTEVPAEEALRAEDSLQAASGEMGRSSGLEEFTEVLTLLSLRGDVASLRRSLGEAGGQLLELKSLDPSKSRDLARPFEEDIPSGQAISRGWRIRALLPAGKVAGFIKAVEEDSRFRILDRTRTPASRRPAPGIRSLEINVVR